MGVSFSLPERCLSIEEVRCVDAPHRVRQLRDPAIDREGQRVYLVYSIAGDNGLAMATLAQQ